MEKPVVGQIYYDKCNFMKYVITYAIEEKYCVLYEDGDTVVYGKEDILTDKLIGTCSMPKVMDYIFGDVKAVEE